MSDPFAQQRQPQQRLRKLGVALGKQNTRIRIVSEIALNSYIVTMKIRGSSPPWSNLRCRSIQQEYGGIEYAALPLKSAYVR